MHSSLSFIFILVAFVVILENNVAYSQSTCATFLRPTVCGVLSNDSRVQASSSCPLANASAVGAPLPFDAYWLDSRGPLTHCQLNGQTRIYPIPTWLRTTLTSMYTLISFSAGVNYLAEAFINVVTVDGIEHELGTIIPNVNAVVGSSRTLQGPQSSGYPFNAGLLCGGVVSYQRWEIPASLSSQGVLEVRIYDPRSAVRTYALTINNCTEYPFPNALADVSLNSTSTTDTNAQFITTVQTPSWPMCALAASNAAAEAFIFSPNTERCTTYNVTRQVVRGEATTVPLTFGALVTSPKLYGTTQGMPSRASTPQDAWSILRSDLFGTLTPRLIPLYNTASQRTVPRVVLWATGVTKYAVGASQMTMPTQAFITTVADGRVGMCGSVLGPQNQFLTPFYKSSSNSSYCDKFQHCVVRAQANFTGPLSVDLSTWPNRTICASQAAMLLVYTDGTIGGSTYNYLVYTTSQYPNVAAAKIALAARHEIPTIDRYESYATAQGFAHLYNINGSIPSTTSPPWKATNSKGRTVNTTLWCNAYDVPHYEAAYRVTSSAVGYNCGNYATMEAITLACAADTNCLGFSTLQSLTVESPECLFSDVSTTTSDNLRSLFVKKGINPSCTFPTMGGQRVSVRVTSSVTSSALYEVVADGAVVGSCTGLPTTDASDASCYNTFSCFTGNLPQGTVNLVVRASSYPLSTQRRCGRSTLGVAVSFESEFANYDPPSSCLTTLPIASCVSSPVTNPCSGTRTRSGISIGATSCSIATETGVISNTISSNAYVGVVIVLDMSAVPAAAQSSGQVHVQVETADGSVVPIGHITRQAGGMMRHFSTEQTPVDSFSLCFSASAASEGYAHYFVIPQGLRDKGLVTIRVRGVGAKVVSLQLASAGCEAPLPTKATDVMFSYNTIQLTPSAPLVAPAAAASDYGSCALSCFTTTNCFVYSYMNGNCYLHNAYGLVIANGASGMTGFRIFSSASAVAFPSGIAPTNNLATAIGALQQYTSTYAFVANTSLPLTLLGSAVSKVRVMLSQGAFAGAASVTISTSGVGGAIKCGNNFMPWEGASGQSGQCQTLAACPELDIRTAVNEHIQLSWSNLQEQCGSSVWGLVGVAGSLSSIQYFAIQMSANSTPPTGPLSAVSVGLSSVYMDGTPYTLSLLEQYNTPTAAQINTNTPVLCRIVQKVLYRVVRDMAPINTTLCGSATNLADAMAACTLNEECRGISISSTTGAFLCYSTTSAAEVSATQHLLVKVFESSCTFNMAVPGVLKVSIAQLNLFYGAGNDAKVYINERLVGRCGYTEPFIGGFEKSSASNCSNYLTCVSELVPESGTLRIELPSTSTLCGGHYGSVIVQLSPAASESRALHRGAATMPYRRAIRTATPTTSSFMVSGASQVATLTRQDRYRCGVGCTIPSQLNLTVGAALERLCGGLSGFEDGDGLTGACSTYYYCGPSSAGNPVSFTSITAYLTYNLEAPYRSTAQCDSIFNSLVFSNGIMLASDATNYATRTLFAKPYAGTPSTTVASVTADLRDYALSAHIGMPPSSITDSLRTYDKSFPIYDKLLTVSTNGFVLYDFANVNEADKTVHNGTYACIGDQVSVDGREVICQMRFTTNYVSVAVAQTKYDTVADTITVITSNMTKICGGDRSFFGLRGTLDQCNRYYTCFEGYIEPGELVTVRFSPSVISNSRCRPNAVALLSGSERELVPDLVCDNPALPFKCYPSRTCLSMRQVCDRFVDCGDQSDEADCTVWKYIANDISPTCARSGYSSTITTVDDCTRYAVMDALRPTVFTVNSTGCYTYTCVDFSAPRIQNLAAGSGTQLYALVINPSDFGYCSSSLHCSGHGKVLSATAPCICACDANYVGDSCESLSSLGIARQLVVVLDKASPLTSQVISQVENAVLSRLPSLYTVVVSAVEDRANERGLFLTIRDSVAALVPSDVLLGVLINTTATQIVRSLRTVGGLYITATQSATPRADFTCQDDGSGSSVTCDGDLVVSINSTRSVTVALPGISFLNATQRVLVTITSSTTAASTTYICNASNAIISTDYSQTTACSGGSVCMFALSDGELLAVDKVHVEMTLGARSCSSANLASITLDGRIFFGDDTLADYTPTSSSEYQSIYLYIFFVLLAVGLISFIALVTWCRLQRKYPNAAFVGPLSGGLTLFFITFSIVLLIYYFDSEEDKYSHSVVLEDYRDRECENSIYAPVPVRATTVPGDTKCSEVRFVGQTEESLFMAARLPVDRTHPIAVRFGNSYATCSSANWIDVFPRTCLAESAYFPDKLPIDLQYVSFRGMLKALASVRLNSIKALNPTAPTSIDVPVAILPPLHRYLSIEGTATFLHRGLAYNMVHPTQTPLYLMASTAADPYLAAPVIPTEPVRFQQLVLVKKSAVGSGTWETVDEAPATTSSDMSNMGTLFDSLLTREDRNAFIGTRGGGSNAFTYSGVDNGPFDLNKRTSDYTLSLWVRCPSTARGVAFAVMDGWLDEDYTSPLIERVVSILENGDLGPQWFNSWSISSALYLNGGSGRISLVTANAADGVKTLDWNAFDLGVERLFDGTWHFLAFVVTVEKTGEMRVKLHVDGEYHISRNGWTSCANKFFQPLSSLSTSQVVSVTSQGAVVTPDGSLGVGYFSGGVYGLAVHDFALSQQEVFQMGSSGMQYYSGILVSERLALGICTAIITAALLLYAIYVVFRREFGVNEEEFEEETVYDERGHRIRQNTEIRETKSSIFTSSVSFVNFISPVILLFQIITMFMQSFEWPEEYRDYFNVLAVVSIDLDALNVDAPIMLWPIIQFIAAIALFIIMIVLAGIDRSRFVAVTEMYREKVRVRQLEAKSRNRRVNDDVEMVDVPKPEYQWVVHTSNGTLPLTAEQADQLNRSLTEILQSRARRETNMRVLTKSLVNMGDLGEGIILYERIAGNVYISFRTSRNTLEHNQQSDVIEMTQTYFEQRCNNVECPDHKKRLLPDDLHASTCVHSSNPYYRSNECPRKCIMYKCPNEHCDYAVCEFCYAASGASAVSGAVSDALKRLKSVRQVGILQTFGSLVALFWGIIYIPAVKNALMIITCHKRYRCEFDNCWQNPSAYYMFMVLVSVLVLTCVAVGYIFIEVWILHHRRKQILQLLPQQVRKPKNAIYDFIMPKKTINRGDYNDFLDEDTSILRSFYTSYEFDYFYANPALVLYRLALVISVVVPSEGSLVQLGLATAVSMLFTLLLILASMYKNVWVELLVRLGALHILVELALMSLHQADLRDNLFSTGYVNQMVAVTFLYIGIVALLWVITVVVPFIREQWANRQRRQKQKMNATEEMYDIGFWGEIRASTNK